MLNNSCFLIIRIKNNWCCHHQVYILYILFTVFCRVTNTILCFRSTQLMFLVVRGHSHRFRLCIFSVVLILFGLDLGFSFTGFSVTSCASTGLGRLAVCLLTFSQLIITWGGCTDIRLRSILLGWPCISSWVLQVNFFVENWQFSKFYFSCC